MTQTPLLDMRGIARSFGPVKALRGVNFTLMPGEIHALAGENGAGKSTLMNIADGILQPDAGEIRVEGRPVRIGSPLEAQRLGIGLIHQEIALCGDVSVAENICMAALAASPRWLVSRRALIARAQEVMDRLMPIPVTRLVRELSLAEQQLVEIAKALTLDAKVLILDEPTAALTEAETDTLFGLMRELRARGIGQVYISHRMSEIFDICDRITVFRDGQYIGTDRVADMTPAKVVDKLVGRKLEALFPPKAQRTGPGHVMEVEALTDRAGQFHDVSFALRRGEILGLAGLIGAGRTEIAEAICGLRPRASGRVVLEGTPFAPRDHAASVAARVAYLSEDRKGAGLFLELPIARNISALDIRTVAPKGWIEPRRETARAETLGARVKLKCGSVADPVSTLSGGNQQKVAIARLLAIGPRLVFLDEPTRGVDVGARAEIYDIIRALAEAGTGVVVISSELTELIGLCDRVLVIHEGRVAGAVSGAAMSEENIMHLASGLGTAGAEAPEAAAAGAA
ncbi:sugar ABC transporter ATP-binding protein [Oceanicella sp. SM1341]|uniref:sugar ABC transporter ATP-binding protein n=1 Tax=Oceanicella sp. SM1341 TaxID=1548889 RepID=UPI000E4EC487|nr:sugar ABC transporter ATP-binding protein [Oceanicella sp. SM1341]